MANKKEENTKTKKSVKEVKKVNEDISIDLTDIKNDLTEYMQEKIDKEVSKSVEKSTKKLIRYKNSIILKKNIIIVILLLIIAFLGFSLYKASDISINISSNKNKTVKAEKKEKTKTEEKTKEDEFEEKKEKYEHLIDDIYVNDESVYIKDFYKGNLTEEVKEYIALNNIPEDKITYEDESTYIDADALKESYDNFFEDEFSPKSFEYNNVKFHYLNSKSLFIGNGKLEKKKGNIKKEIITIEEDDEMKITTVEGKILDKKLYNIVSQDEIKNYKDDDLKKYKKDLSLITYKFKKDDDKFKLLNIEVK